MFNLRPEPAVHCSRKEVKRLRRAGYSLRGAALVLGVSKSQVQRVAKGYRCRCGACPPNRSVDEMLGLLVP